MRGKNIDQLFLLIFLSTFDLACFPDNILLQSYLILFMVNIETEVG